VRWVTPNDMSKDRTQVLNGGERTLTQDGLESCGARLFPAGSVIVSSRAPVGYVAIAGSDMCTNQGCKTAIPPEYVDSRYLYWYLTYMRPDLEARASGTTFKEISKARFAETTLIWPAIGEQRRIVDILEDHLSRLDAADAYLDATRRRLVAMERSALDKLFGGRDVALDELIDDVSAGKSFGSANAPARDGEWGIIKVSAMTWGEFNATENKAVPADRVDPRFEIHEGDLLVSRANTDAYVGASVLVGRVRPRLLLSDKSLRVTPKPGVRREWLWRVLQSPSARRQLSRLATGTKESMRNISQDSLRKVLVPSTDELTQDVVVRDFAETSAAITRMRAELHSAQRRSAILRRSLLAAAFSGRLTGSSPDMSEADGMISA
jgi:type I restriction enzyme S subunit